MAEALESLRRKGKKIDICRVTMMALLCTYKPDAMFVVCITFIGELCVILYAYMTGLIVEFIQDPDAPIEWGAALIVMFTVLVWLNNFLRNTYMQHAQYTALRFRRTLTIALYDKVGTISLRSLHKISTSRLINLISSDIFNIEKYSALLGFIVVTPMLNFIVFAYIGVFFGWENLLVVAGLQAAFYFLQLKLNSFVEPIKVREGKHNDKRVKLVTDMISGIRTVKCYAWERHYLQKIKEMRNKQSKELVKFKLLRGFGVSVSPTIGLVIAFAVFVTQWALGRELDNGMAFSLLAIIYMLNFVANSLGNTALNTLFQY